MTDQDQAAAKPLVEPLEAAWTRADGDAFAAEFAEDADFVNIRGDYFSGREAVAHGHAAIFGSIYAGSRIRYSVARLRELAPGVLLAHLDAHLHVPPGPAARDISAIPSLVLVADDGAWRIASFHNTTRLRA